MCAQFERDIIYTCHAAQYPFAKYSVASYSEFNRQEKLLLIFPKAKHFEFFHSYLAVD